MKFIDRHLGMSRKDFANIPSDTQGTITIAEVATPTLKAFLEDLKRVGGKYGWDKRPKYLDHKAVAERLAEDTTRYFYILKDGKPIGYTLVTKPKETLSRLKGQKVIEIENFGLFGEFTGKGYGKPAFRLVLSELLKDNEYVYLSTRSTNHDGVVSFYKDVGLELLKKEEKLNDLVPKRIPPAIKFG